MKQIIRTAVILLVGLSTGACSSDEAVQPDKSVERAAAQSSESAAVGNLTGTAGRTVLVNASWGPVDDTAEEPVERIPTVVSHRVGQLQKFEREAGERWKNTEIFIVR